MIKRVIFFFLALLTVAGIEMCSMRNAYAGVAGWNFTWWDCCGSSTGVINAINWNGVYTGSGYRNYLSGYVKWPGTTGTSKTINFQVGYDDGHKLNVNGATVASGPCCGWNYGSYTANAGDIVKLEFWSDNYGGGPYSGFVLWDPQGDGTYEFVTGASIATTADYWVPQYSAGISIGQQSRVTSAQNRMITNNSIYIDQVGDNNTVNITQTGNKSVIGGIGQQAASIQGNNNSITIRQGDIADTGKNEINLRSHGDSNTLNINQGVTTTGSSTGSTNNHYQSVDIIGSYNAVTTQQTNTGGIGGHYMETTVNGNTNNVTTKQLDNGNKTMFTTVTGNNNTVASTQSGTGQHYLETVLMGNGNTATIVQSGSAANNASISITNAGGPGSVDLQQTGGQVYNISTSCVTAGGCAPIVVRQGN